MERLNNGFTLELCAGAFPLSTDSIALANFVKLPKNANVLDLGSGCGTLGLLLCAERNDCSVTGIEIDPNAHETALKNAATNQLSGRLISICQDAGQIPTFIKPGSYKVCVSNPPYFTDGFKSKTAPNARHEDLLPLEVLFSSASLALRYGGDFYLIHKPERLAELFVAAFKHNLEPKQLQLLHHHENGPVSLVLVKFRKGAKPGLKWDDQCLFDRNGETTAYYKQLYHL